MQNTKFYTIMSSLTKLYHIKRDDILNFYTSPEKHEKLHYAQSSYGAQ